METNTTALQWFIDQLPIRIINAYHEEIQKALDLEKTQTQNAYNKGYNESWDKIQTNLNDES